MRVPFLCHGSSYDSGNDLLEEVVPNVDPSHISWPSDAMHRTPDLPLSTIQSYLVSGRPVIANVMKGAHFVLVVGWQAGDNDTLLVNDPGFDRDTYSFANDVVGWRLFDMTPVTMPAVPFARVSRRLRGSE